MPPATAALRCTLLLASATLVLLPLCGASPCRSETHAIQSPAVWLAAPWDELAATPERIFLLLIYAYMFKDLGLYLLDARMDAMYWAHHIGCWVIILQFFFTTAPGIFIFGGGVAMEFGGAAQTIHLLYPDDATLDLIHVATMTLSHVPCGVREPSRRRAGVGRPRARPGGRRSSGLRRRLVRAP